MRKLLAVLGALAALAAFGFLAFVPLAWETQARIGVLMFVAALLLHWISRSSAVTLTLVLFSLFSSTRYFVWRVTETWRYWSASGTDAFNWDLPFVVLLLGAETYALTILALGYFQSARPLRRKPVALPRDPAEWPVVDVFIPTYNEPLSLVRATIVASKLIDWPAEKLRVHVLDDGARADFRAFCEETKTSYFARTDNKHAKAGNINHALSKTKGEYVVIFDCDHIPTRSFLQMTMGWFLRDEKLAMLQTPHHFYSPDPFERNLDTFRRVPNEGNLFYGVVQDGNDLWNASFFCGSAAVLRRTALEEVGGIAVETVTEDAHTSLRLQRAAWNTAYINLPLIGGLATASLADHITQRIRWARGMVQILRIENPLFAGGLTLAQRLCYFNCMIHFLYAVPRLIFLTSPLVYLLLGLSNFYGSVFAITAYAFPHLALAMLTNSRVQGRFRHTFWNEIYETVLSPYFVLPTLLALVNPKWGKFNVTPKTRSFDQTYLDWRIALPFIALLALNVAGLAVGIPRMFLDRTYAGTVAINVFWTIANTWTLAAAIAAAQEKRQMRASQRLEIAVPATVRIASGEQASGETINVSWGGLAVKVRGIDVSRGQQVAVALSGVGAGEFGGTVVDSATGLIRVKFDPLSRGQEQKLTRLMFGRADSWLKWNEPIPLDMPVFSLFRVLMLSLRGVGAMIADTFRLMRPAGPHPVRRGSVALPLILLAAVLLSLLAVRGWAAPAPPFKDTATFGDLASELEIHGLSGRISIPFNLPVTKLVSNASLRLRFRAAPALTPEKSRLQVNLNGSPVADLPLPGRGSNEEVSVDLPSDLFVTENNIVLTLAGECVDCDVKALVTRFESSSALEFSGNAVELANEVSLLPAPFFLPSSQRSLRLPFVFDSTPDGPSLEAAGVVASWFGVLTDHRGATFPVSSATLPKGNIVVFTHPGSAIAQDLGVAALGGPAVAIRDNPSDVYSKALILVGANGADLLGAARALATRRLAGSGGAVAVIPEPLPPPRAPYDAPRWIRSAGLVPLVQNASSEQYRVYGEGAAQVFFRLAPDLHFDTRTSVPLTVAIDASNLGIARANVAIRLNGTTIGTIALSPSDAGKPVVRTFVAPVNALFPRNTLAVEFSYRGLAGGSVIPVGRVLAGTQLDLRDIPHFVRLPRLDLFAKAGYPFTQMADLSTTAVVMPATPSPAQIATYLEAVAFLSAQTGYPALRHSVVPPTRAPRVNKDLLIIGSPADQPLLATWARSMPVDATADGWRLQGASSLAARLWNEPFRTAPPAEDAIREQLAIGAARDVVIQGFAHPEADGRAVIAITTRSSGFQPELFAALTKVSESSDGASSVIVAGPAAVRSADVPTASVDRGRLQGFAPAYNWVSRHAVLLPLAALLLSAISALYLARSLDRRAAARNESRA